MHSAHARVAASAATTVVRRRRRHRRGGGGGGQTAASTLQYSPALVEAEEARPSAHAGGAAAWLRKSAGGRGGWSRSGGSRLRRSGSRDEVRSWRCRSSRRVVEKRRLAPRQRDGIPTSGTVDDDGVLGAREYAVRAIVPVLKRGAVRVSPEVDVGASFEVWRDEDLSGSGARWGGSEVCHGSPEAGGEGGGIGRDVGARSREEFAGEARAAAEHEVSSGASDVLLQRAPDAE